LIGGSSCISPVKAAPRRKLLMARVPGLIQSGRETFTQSTGKSQIGICSNPPPTCFHEPTRAGSEHTARIAWPPPMPLERDP
jgi:hypothetical protein